VYFSPDSVEAAGYAPYSPEHYFVFWYLDASCVYERYLEDSVEDLALRCSSASYGAFSPKEMLRAIHRLTYGCKRGSALMEFNEGSLLFREDFFAILRVRSTENLISLYAYEKAYFN